MVYERTDQTELLAQVVQPGQGVQPAQVVQLAQVVQPGQVVAARIVGIQEVWELATGRMAAPS